MVRKMIPLGGTVKVVDTATGAVVEEKPSGMMLMPAREGTCPECAVTHNPELPHNADSLFYQMQFHAAHGRWPTWSDALAHCSPQMRAAWERELRARNIWPEPDTIGAADQVPTAPGAGAPDASAASKKP